MHNAARSLYDSKNAVSDPQARLDTATRYVENIRDALGKPVDVGIKSLVTALNAFEFPTTASCEGHLDWGVSAPWIDVGPKPTQESIALRGELCALDAEIETLMNEDPESLTLEVLTKKQRTLETEIRRPTLVLAHSLVSLLAAFYRDRRVPYDQMISLCLRFSWFRIECHGTALQDIAMPAKKMTNLRRYQVEMCTFAAFLVADNWQRFGE
jgi:hypothetical protein